MCENVNINVSETNETINIVATEVQEVIDINVFETAEDVTLNITEQLIQVNVNKVTAAEQIQSDWAQTDNEALDFIKNKPTIPTNTSDLINDGEDGVNPFITANDIPPVTGFVPYTGATEDVNLGEFGLLTGNVEFDNTPTNIPTTAGAMYWNDADGTADLILKGGNVKLQIGQESVIRVVNKTATNINLLEANYQAVRVTGAQGQRLKVDLAQATNDNLSAETIGLVTETINNNQEGFITTSGLVRNINTTGSLQGETWADGDILYLSPTTAGNVTKVKPTAPNHLVIIGYVVHAHANQGSIFVKVDNGYELDELHNVKITSAANNNVLAYTSATDIWENKTVETTLGYTPENVANKSTSTSLGTSDTLYPTQNAVKVYADTKFTLPSLTSGSVLFSNGSTIAQDNSQLFWDDTNNRLGINNPAPFSSVTSTVNGLEIGIYNSAGNEGNLTVRGFASLGGITRSSYGAVGSNYYLDSANALRRRVADSVSVIDFAVGGFLFKTAGNAAINTPISLTELMRINANGNVLINTTTDAGFRLDVNGTARVNGNATFGTLGTGTGMFWDNTNNRLGIGTNAPTEKLTINGNAFISRTNTTTQVYIGLGTLGSVTPSALFWSFGLLANSNDFNIQSYDGTTLSSRLRIFTNGNIGINTTTDAGFKLDVNGTARVQTSISLANATGVGRIILPATGTTSADGIGFGDYFIHRSAAEKIRFSASNSSRYLEFTSLSTFSSITAAGATSQLNLTTNVTNSASVTIGSVNNNVTVARNGSQSNTLMFIRNGSLLSTGNILEIQNYLGTVALFDINGSLILGANNISTSAILQADSTTKGFLPPRMTTTQKNAIASPAAGLVVYDTTLGKLCVRTAAAWETITSI